jgi:phytoene dehydrogenase-like protein
MNENGRNVVIIGGGIAGLCTAVYALACGYHVDLYEMHDMAGGLAMSWRRGQYRFETCLHWLVGSKPAGDLHAQWQEVCDMDRLKFIDPEIFVHMEDEAGGGLTIFTGVDRLEAELLRRAPQDAAAIHDLTHAIRALGKFRMMVLSSGFGENWQTMLHDIPVLPLVRRLSRISGRQYAERFSDPLLKSFFGEGDLGKMPVLALLISLAWMNDGNAGYCIGGSQALIRLIEERIEALGGKVHFGTKVTRILVQDGRATGIQLANGEIVPADWVVSAADGHATLFELLGGNYVDDLRQRVYAEKELFASYLQVSLGIAADLRDQPPMVTRLLDQPIPVDPGTETKHISFRFFHFDPTFAPKGNTAVTSLLLTRNFEYWADLREHDPILYRAEKQRVAQSVIGVLEKRIPGIRAAIEVVDVSTPATIIRYTGNWKGSMEGWLPAPGSGFRPYPNRLPGLEKFLMVGQWVMSGGGLPSGPMTARPAVREICRQDHVPFTPAAVVEKRELVGV